MAIIKNSVSGLISVLAIAVAIPAQASETVTYKYDAKGRLIEVKRTGTVNSNVNTTYQHDKADNRKNVTTTGSPNAPPPP